MKKSFKRVGYTIVELMIVVAVVGILSTITIVSLNDSRDNARYAAAEQEIKILTDAMLLAESQRSSIGQITGSYCSACSCTTGQDLKNISDASACVVRWRTSLTNILNASPNQDFSEDLIRDPWGSPYLLDENEQEPSQPGSPCRIDTIRTAGPDGIRNTTDDYTVELPFRTSDCS